MYSFMHNLLADRKGDVTFSCFGLWHFCYIAVVLVAMVAALCLLKRRSGEGRRRGCRAFLHVAFGLYVADFFLMPFAYGEIDIEKLPFHACTAMCVMCFLGEHCASLKKYRLHFVLLGLISNLVYLLYPAGVMWYQVHPLSYRVVQTLAFHGTMTIYGVLTLALDEERLAWKHCYRDLLVLISMTAWALVGNILYNGEAEGYAHFFNWFFVVRDPFYLLPESISPYVMPLLNVVVFFAAEMLVYALYFGIRKIGCLVRAGLTAVC